MTADDKIPVIYPEKGPQDDTKKTCGKSHVKTIWIGCILTAVLIVLVVVASFYISDLKDEINERDNRETRRESSKQWKNQQTTKRGMRVHHPEMTMEAEQVWLETQQDLELGHITGKPVAIYRKDLDKDYVAYWEIAVNHTEYVIISAGKRTGDWKRVVHGNLPSLTQMLDKKANGKTCVTYYMMSPSVELMCDNINGRIVTTTLDTLVNVDTDPHQYVIKHLSTLKEAWIKHAYDVSTAREWDDVDVSKGDKNDADDDPGNDDVIRKDAEDDQEEEFFETAAVPGHPIIIAVGEVRKLLEINIRYQPSSYNDTNIDQAQFNLCQCTGVCKDNDRYAIDTALIHIDNDTGLGYMRFEICKSAKRIFGGNEISFTVEIVSKDGTILRKRFGLEFETSRKRRGVRPWSEWTESGIPDENLFPHYGQFYYIKKKSRCKVGSAAVAWAQVFGYYDRRSHLKEGVYGSGSQPLYRTKGAVGENSAIAPFSSQYSGNTIKDYIKHLAQLLHTQCNGVTSYSKMTVVSNFFKSRQTGLPFLVKQIVENKWSGTKDGIIHDDIRKWAGIQLDLHWPVIVGYKNPENAYSYGVATKWKTRTRQYRIFGGPWKTQIEYYMYIHGGGAGNLWRKNLGIWYAVVAEYFSQRPHFVATDWRRLIFRGPPDPGPYRAGISRVGISGRSASGRMAGRG